MSRKKEIIKIRSEINVAETKKKKKKKKKKERKKINEIKSWFFENINEIYKPLPRLSKKTREECK